MSRVREMTDRRSLDPSESVWLEAAQHCVRGWYSVAFGAARASPAPLDRAADSATPRSAGGGAGRARVPR